MEGNLEKQSGEPSLELRPRSCRIGNPSNWSAASEFYVRRIGFDETKSHNLHRFTGFEGLRQAGIDAKRL